MNSIRGRGTQKSEINTQNGLAITAFFILLLGVSGIQGLQLDGSLIERTISSLPFPRHSATTDQGDILADYPDYLRFVLEIGKDVDSATSKQLAKTYETLRRRDPRGAARFLRGLRFEMVQKLELLGASPSSMNTSNATMRAWVRRYLAAWHREADEYLFRSIAFKSRQE